MQFSKTAIDFMVYMNNYVPSIYIDVITQQCYELNAGLVKNAPDKTYEHTHVPAHVFMCKAKYTIN